MGTEEDVRARLFECKFSGLGRLTRIDKVTLRRRDHICRVMNNLRALTNRKATGKHPSKSDISTC